jgi:hypothetical protein
MGGESVVASPPRFRDPMGGGQAMVMSIACGRRRAVRADQVVPMMRIDLGNSALDRVEVIRVERTAGGLVNLHFEGGFYTARPDGRVTVVA